MTVAPAGMAFVFQDEAAPSAAELDVEAARCVSNALATDSIEHGETHGDETLSEMDSNKLARAVGCDGMGWMTGRPYRTCFAGSTASRSAGRARGAEGRSRQHYDLSWLRGGGSGEV